MDKLFDDEDYRSLIFSKNWGFVSEVSNYL